jgi:hypothetical protein
MFESNLPNGFDIAKQYSPIRTAEEKERQRELYNDPEFRSKWNIKNQEAIDLKVQDPIWYANLVARNQALATNEERNNAISKTVSFQWSDPEYKQQRVENHRKITGTEEFKKAHKKGLKVREANGWEEKNAAAARKRRKPIQTPYGRFESKGEAVAGMTAAGVSNAGGRLGVWLDPTNPKNRCTEYYYIKEENEKSK